MVNAQSPTPVPDIGGFHILINHFPVILTIVGTAAAVLALIVRKRAVWLYATATLFLAGLSVIPTFLTGDPAADDLRNTWYVTRKAIRAHDDAAEFTLWGLIIMGLIAAYAWWRAWRRETVVVAGAVHTDRGDVPAEARVRAYSGLPAWLRALVIVSALFGCALVYRTASLGGDILHHSTVLQSTPRPASVPAPPAGGDER
jgi:uncharacterized membrane protein